MTIGQNIKQLRRNADMTQEKLAEMLSISSQAVSRWETDSAMPDILLLPLLANIFNVTTDSLLGVDISNKEAHIKSIIEEAHETGKSGRISEAAEIIRNGIAKYPNSYELLSELQEYLYLLSNHSPAKEKTIIRKEIISLGEKVIANCTDNDYGEYILNVSDLYRNIAAVFSRKNDIAKSLEYLKKAVTINVSFDNSYKPTQVHTSLLLRNDIYDDFFCTDTNNASLSLLIDINSNEDFNAVKKEAGFADLCNELKKVAGNRN